MFLYYIWITATIVICVHAELIIPPERQFAQRQDSNTTSAAVQALLDGLQNHINAQSAEKAVLSQMQTLASAPTPSPNLQQAAKDDLLAFMTCGSRIRGNNMNLSSINAQVSRGLAQVGVHDISFDITLTLYQLEATQVLQMASANSLNGTASDGPTLASLQSGVDAAIQENKMLQAIATGGT